MLGSSNKTAAEVRDCFDLAAEDISDLGVQFSISFWSLVSDIWVYL